MTPKTVTIIGLENFPLVKAGDDLAKMIVEATVRNNVEIEDKDIIVVSQKIVSKAEGRVVKFEEINPSEKAKELAEKVQRDPKLVELVLKETDSIVKASPEILIVKDKRGLICINAGVDKSNVPRNAYSLLPENPDESARKIKKEIEKLTGKKVAVVIVVAELPRLRRNQHLAGAQRVVHTGGVSGALRNEDHVLRAGQSFQPAVTAVVAVQILVRQRNVVGVNGCHDRVRIVGDLIVIIIDRVDRDRTARQRRRQVTARPSAVGCEE